MDAKQIFKSDFKEWVALHKNDYPGGYLESLIQHERFSEFEKNMTKQLSLIISNRKLRSDRMTLKQVVYSMAKAFADLAKKYRDEHYMNEIEKHRIIAEYDRKKELDESSKPESCTIQSS